MKDKQQDVTCPICRRRNADTEEHVWPKWFLKRMDAAGAPPAAWTVNGVPVRRPDGRPVKLSERQRVLLRVCKPCNQAMEKRFESPAKPLVERLAKNRWAGSLDHDEWRVIGHWWAKVLLLQSHPLARYGDELLNRHARVVFDYPLPELSWMTDGSPMPAGLSLFVYHADPSDSTPSDVNLVIPEWVVDPVGVEIRCHVIAMATPGLGAIAVWHPGLRIDHPLVRGGDAWELVHQPPASGSDLSQAPLLGRLSLYMGIAPGTRARAGQTIDESSAMKILGFLGDV